MTKNIFVFSICFAVLLVFLFFELVTEEPTRKALDSLIDNADRMVIYANEHVIGFSDDKINAEKLYESIDRKDFEELKKAIVVKPPEKGIINRTFCIGSDTIYFYSSGSDKEKGAIANICGEYLRVSVWKDDQKILDKEKFASWFEKRGIKISTEDE